MSRHPCGPDGWWGLSSGQPRVRVLGPYMSLYQQAGVIRSCVGCRGRRGQLVGVGGQFVCPLVALQPNVAWHPLQPQASPLLGQPCHLVPHGPHQEGARVAPLDPE